MMEKQRATRDSWKTIPMSEERHSININRSFSLDEYEILSRGDIPEGMDDKWFIFMEDDCLYFHSSWTGDCNFQVKLKQEKDQYIVQGFFGCGDRSGFRGKWSL